MYTTHTYGLLLIRAFKPGTGERELTPVRARLAYIEKEAHGRSRAVRPLMQREGARIPRVARTSDPALRVSVIIKAEFSIYRDNRRSTDRLADVRRRRRFAAHVFQPLLRYARVDRGAFRSTTAPRGLLSG